MILTLWLGLLLVIPEVHAGGYQGALERVWIYYAYSIDGLNDSSAHTLGKKCVGADWDAKTGQCAPGKWKRCEDGPKQKGRRCNFNELMAFLGKIGKPRPLVPGSDQNTKTPSIRETAVNYLNFRLSQVDGKVTDFPPQYFCEKTNGEYNNFIEQVNEVVAKSPHKAGNEALFDGFKECTNQVIEARIGDHAGTLADQPADPADRKYIAAARDYLAARGITVKAEKIGDWNGSPEDRNGKKLTQWYTVDWAETVKGSALAFDDTIRAIQNFHVNFFQGKSADDHGQVIRSYRTAADKLNSC